MAELQRRLSELGDTVLQDTAVRDALIEAMRSVEQRAKQYVPVRTGNLKQSITTSDTLAKAASNPNNITVHVGTSYELGTGGRHGHLVEFGTVKSGARPFLRPAWDAEREAVIKKLQKALEKAISKAAKKKK